ncbi:uncharacterized protein LOC126791248 [Argentina anserina]|uniref:uncharacterized protein LOC126791248 n=1 Tax=Argentina anserina TaxID=57926 RepID=UPI0021762F5D|nr:uncharacterized protein LOC126791248 [Potentilla anserina]
MSRCFPFPPPGYEKKARADDVNVLKKEKQREKKHKKDKKDKEKREREKSEKDRSDGKHREKKDKKEKNREKKKDKEKDTEKVKDKPGISDGTRMPEISENHVAERLIHKDDRDKRDASQVGGSHAEKLGQNSHLPVENRNSVSVEVARKTKDEARGIKNQFVEKISGPDLPVEKRNSVSVELARKTKDEARRIKNQLGEKITGSDLLLENRNSVSVELARKTTEEVRGIKNQLAEKITGSDHKKDEGMVRFVAKGTGIVAEVKETSKDKRVDIRKPDVHEVRVAPRVSESAMAQNPGRLVQNPSGTVQPKVQGIPKPSESNVERKIDGKEKKKEKEGEDKRGEKRKDKDREKKTQGKDKERDKEKKEEKAKKKNASKTEEPDKEKKKEDKTNEKNGSKHSEPDKSRETNKDASSDSQYRKPSHLPKDSYKTADAEGSHKKRKDLKTNGVLHVNELRPNKLLRPSSSHPLIENGRTLEPCQTSIPYVSDKLGGSSSVKVESKEHKKNGIIEAKPSSVSPAKSTSAAAQVDAFAESSLRSPHPDIKYLSEVYMVPKQNELFDDDQDWLFGCRDAKSKRSKVESVPDEETAQVWSEALRIESADVCALPYVIPY